MGVEPKIGGKTPKWMVNIIMVPNPMNKWMIWGYHYFWKHPYGYHLVKLARDLTGPISLER